MFFLRTGSMFVIFFFNLKILSTTEILTYCIKLLYINFPAFTNLFIFIMRKN